MRCDDGDDYVDDYNWAYGDDDKEHDETNTNKPRHPCCSSCILYVGSYYWDKRAVCC